MHIVVHDFAGLPFPVQLSRQLARKGHHVNHLYCQSVVGAKGNLAGQEDDLDRLSIEGLSLGRRIDKANFLRRFVDEYRYGRLAADRISGIAPDVVLCANTPLDSFRMILKRCRERGIKIVNWLQDINSLAIADILPRKIPVLGRLVALHYMAMERRLLHRVDHIIPISKDFGSYLGRVGITPGRYTPIENWAPLDEMPLGPRHNGWAERHGLNGGRCVVYSGNIGFKHNPRLLIDLARAMGEASPCDRLVVVSQGMGADWLAERQIGLKLPNLLLLPFQPYRDVPDIMASSDILIAILEPQGSPYCVPSKVLSYCCSGRAIVLCADPANPASRIVSGNRCGRVVEAGDSPAFTRAVLDLLADEKGRIACGERARRYAEATFDIESIAEKFEVVLENTVV